ncbi:glycosyl transferase [Fervidicella metallireducens AeB]|uniref:Glycosyl transferase n=1 Tax=Fervidicella metallireducens AeB TaxID=1403537 RepID=A0A017RZX4_9CLOT|nr:glycosyltransferase [Fervidicella metallireducens]EYE89475.1 glycosyl transferase [Fervidicella metallireducens AeB]
MKRVIIGDFVEYNDKISKLGNYHYANCFVKDGWEVLWMSNLFNELIYIKDKKGYKFKKSISSPERHELAKNIYGFAPYSLRLYGNYLFSKDEKIVLNNQKYIVPDIKKSLKKIGFDRVDILWISNPKHYYLTNVLDYDKLIFRIPDDFSHHNGFPESVVEIEKRLIDKADVIFITSKFLENKVLERNKKPYLLNNGVDFQHFNKQNLTVPREYHGKEKRVVYVGAIDEWFDVGLIREIADGSDANIFIIGRPRIDLSKIKNLKNVYILGPRPYEEIPSYLKNADVAIIPFIKNQLTDAVSPIKLYEYASSGIPVVSSNLKEVKNTMAPIYVAKDTSDFLTGIKKYLNKEYNREDIINFGFNNSWGARYEYAMKIIYGR